MIRGEDNPFHASVRQEIFLNRSLSLASPIYCFKISEDCNIPVVGREDIYYPRVVSIGPFNHMRKSEFARMERKKWGVVGDLVQELQRIGHPDTDLYDAFFQKEDEIRSFYSESLDVDVFDSGRLQKLMMADGCFIVFFMCKLESIGCLLNSKESLIHMVPAMMYDFLLLENQIPFFVLETIYDIFCRTHTQTQTHPLPNFSELAVSFFTRVLELRDQVTIQTPHPLGQTPPHHLLDLIRSRLIQFPENQNPAEVRPDFLPLLPSLTRLLKGGVQFHQRKNAHGLLDIHFRRGYSRLHLEIPHIKMDDVLCIAYEQYMRGMSSHITSYFMFMNCLLSSPDDAAYLIDKGILQHYVGSPELVYQFFSDTGKYVAFDVNQSYLRELIQEVNVYIRSPKHLLIAEVIYNYLRSPVIIFSVVGAFVIIGGAVLQTVYTVLGYYHK